MRVVLFAGSNDIWECKHLEAALKPIVPKRSFEVFTKLQEFSDRIRRLPRDIDVAVLLIRNDSHLTAMLSLADYLDTVRIILILPDRNHDMVSKGHLLHPRFMAFYDGDFSNIAAVLSKMLRNKKSEALTGPSPQE